MELPFQESLRAHLLGGTDDSFAQCHHEQAGVTSAEMDQIEVRAAGGARVSSTLSKRAGASRGLLLREHLDRNDEDDPDGEAANKE